MAAYAGDRELNDLHWNTVTPAMRAVMRGFSQSALAQEFHLAGGTALTLHLGHRFSVDLHFFSPTQTDIPPQIEPLRHALRPFSPSQSDS